MNKVDYSIDQLTAINEQGIDEPYTLLRITITGKSSKEAAEQYDFTTDQYNLLNMLLDKEYDQMCEDLLGVEVAKKWLGNEGGEKFWRYMGFGGRVSWCANECNYVATGIVPAHALCDDGISWFESRNQWKDGNYKPSPGDVIYFDWDRNGIDNGDSYVSDHVGIDHRR